MTQKAAKMVCWAGWIGQLAFTVTFEEARGVINAHMGEDDPLKGWEKQGLFVCDVLEEFSGRCPQARGDLLGVFLGKLRHKPEDVEIEDFVEALRTFGGDLPSALRFL